MVSVQHTHTSVMIILSSVWVRQLLYPHFNHIAYQKQDTPWWLSSCCSYSWDYCSSVFNSFNNGST